jgi:hypothetical protein
VPLGSFNCKAPKKQKEEKNVLTNLLGVSIYAEFYSRKSCISSP